MTPLSDTLAILFWVQLSPIVNALATLGIPLAIAFLLRRKAAWVRHAALAAVLVPYIAVAAFHAYQSSQKESWLAAQNAKAGQTQLSLPKSLWIDPGHCSENCSAYHGSYWPSRVNNPAILSLLFEGQLDFVDFGHDEIWHYTRARGKDACAENAIVPAQDARLSDFAKIHHICVRGVRIEKSDAAWTVTSDFVAPPFDPGYKFHRITLTENATGQTLAEGYHAYHYPRHLPSLLAVTDPMQVAGLWSRSTRSDILTTPPQYGTPLNVWAFHTGFGVLDADTVIEQYGIDENMIIAALRSEEIGQSRPAILFSCHNRADLNARIMAEVDAIAQDPGRSSHKLARSVREGWCSG